MLVQKKNTPKVKKALKGLSVNLGPYHFFISHMLSSYPQRFNTQIYNFREIISKAAYVRLYKIFVCLNFHQIFNGSWSRLGWTGVLLCKKITQDAHDEGALPINCYKNKRKILHMVN